MNNVIYKFFSNCILVRGASRSTICDLQRNKYFLVPNSIFDLVEDDIIDMERVMQFVKHDDYPILNEYLDYLKEHEVIFECDKQLLPNFPKLSLEWDYPSHISNAIFDAEDKLSWFNKELLDQLEQLCCNYLELRFFGIADKIDLERVLELINISQIKCIDLILKFDPEINFTTWLLQLVVKNPKIRCINVHSADKTAVIRDSPEGSGIVLFIKEHVHSELHCGTISHITFSSNIQLFSESQSHNSCLNRKVSIDRAGNIKNCPSMTESYGNVRDTTLFEAIGKNGFKKYWNVSKNEIAVCKDCEFRHICTDCRAYRDDPNDILSKPLKCGYDPYTCQWTEWSTNPLKKRAIEHYSLKEKLF